MKIVAKEITLKMKNLEMYAMICWDTETLCFLTNSLLLKGGVQFNIHTYRYVYFTRHKISIELTGNILCSKQNYPSEKKQDMHM